MKLDKRVTVDITEQQYNFVKTLANAKYEGKFSQALRTLLQELMKPKE